MLAITYRYLPLRAVTCRCVPLRPLLAFACHYLPLLAVTCRYLPLQARISPADNSVAPPDDSEAAAVSRLLDLPLILDHLHARPRVATDALRLIRLGAALLPQARNVCNGM